jgi:hypothetical protein
MASTWARRLRRGGGEILELRAGWTQCRAPTDALRERESKTAMGSRGMGIESERNEQDARLAHEPKLHSLEDNGIPRTCRCRSVALSVESVWTMATKREPMASSDRLVHRGGRFRAPKSRSHEKSCGRQAAASLLVVALWQA